MGMREKLIELLETLFCSAAALDLADYLIANGVTIVTDTNAGCKWIPVTERLPTEEDANEEGLVLVRNIGCPQYEAMDWDQVKMFRSRISHWMPLPQPPTE